MKKNLLKAIGGSILAILMMALAAQIWVSAQEDNSSKEQTQKNSFESNNFDNGARALEGSWTSQVTFRNCQTGAAIRTLPGHNTFMQGGTMQEFGVASGLFRSPGHGVWSSLFERRFFSAFQFFRFNPDGTYSGSVRARRYIDVDITGNTYTSTDTIDFFDTNGNLTSIGCATETGTRFVY